MTVSDYILLVTALVGAYYAYETQRMRKAVSSQLETLRKTALISAYASLFQVHIRVVEKDYDDQLARQMPHYKTAIERTGQNALKLQKLVDELENT